MQVPQLSPLWGVSTFSPIQATTELASLQDHRHIVSLLSKLKKHIELLFEARRE